MRACNVYHLENIGYPVTLHKLKIHTINTPCQPGNVINSDATLISNNRDWYVLTNEPQPFQITRSDRLFNKFNVIVSQRIDGLNGLLGCPASVSIDTDGRG